MIYTVTLNPALDKTVRIDDFAVDRVNRISALRVDAGGKGINVSKVIAKLGGRSTAIAILGGASGDLIARALADAGIDCLPFEASGDTRTNLKVVDEALGTNTDINEPGPEIDEGTLATALATLTERIEPDDIVVLSGSLPKGAPADTYATWAAACQRIGARVLLDADGEALRAGIAGRPYLIKPNDSELERLVGRPLKDEGAIVAAAREIVEAGVERVVVTLGGDGALFVDAEGAVRARSPKVRVNSTVGAGDSVVASLAFGLDLGLPAAQTVVLAMAAGAANVMSEGTQAAELSVIESLMGSVAYETV